VASRPFHVEELAALLAFDFKAGPIPQFRENWCLEDPLHTVLSTCSSLLAIVDIKGSQVIQFSHSSVKDFLTSTRLAKTSDTIIRRYHISITSAHTLAAQACLGILLHLDENITRDCLQRFPLAEYAARHWLDHARFENVSITVDHGMKLLFDPNKSHLATWLWMYDPVGIWHVKERGERPSRPPGTSLHYAAICGFHTIAKHLVSEYSQDVNACGLHKMSTPLHWASSKGHVEVVRYLLEHGANVTAQSQDGSMPLHWASQKGHIQVIRTLLQHKADAKARDKNKSTPLHRASSRGYAGSARIFLEHGVDATAQDKNGWTPLHCAAFEGHVEVTHVLLKHGVDTTMQDKDGRTPLHHASSEGNLEVTRVLLEHEVDATAQDKDGRSPLHRASFRGHVETVRVLLKKGADVTAQDKTGRTPLHNASLAGHLEVTRVLLEHGADPTAKNKNGQTPSSSARRKGQCEVARIISRYESGVGAQAGDDMPSVRTKFHWESKADIEESISSRVSSSSPKPSIDGNGIISRDGINGARSSGSSGAGTSVVWSFHTARTTLGSRSIRSKGSGVISTKS
jgi:ankyrin repeat protein